MKMLKAILVVIFATTCFVRIAPAQLPKETRKVFEEILDKLDADLQKLFVKALDQDSAIVEFTPEQFKRFRANAANPFEGLEKIDVDKLDGNIALKFELPTVRNRTSGKLERQHPSHLVDFKPVLKSWAQSVVQVKIDNKLVAMGTIVSREGFILTKASELKGKKKVTCVLADKSKVEGEVQGINKKNDIAIVKIKVNGLNPVAFSNSTPKPGAFLVTGNDKGEPVALGVCSTLPRALLSDTPAFLGVRPIDSAEGVKVATVSSPGAAENAGIKVNDILLSIDGIELKSANHLVNRIRQLSPQDKVVLKYKRGDKVSETVAKLTGRTYSTSSQPKKLKQFGAILSAKNAGFPLVFQHDTPLLPEQCGSPVVDLDGKVVGINIARHGRVGSYALPASHVKKIVENMLRRDVASADVDKK